MIFSQDGRYKVQPGNIQNRLNPQIPIPYGTTLYFTAYHTDGRVSKPAICTPTIRSHPQIKHLNSMESPNQVPDQTKLPLYARLDARKLEDDNQSKLRSERLDLEKKEEDELHESHVRKS